MAGNSLGRASFLWTGRVPLNPASLSPAPHTLVFRQNAMVQNHAPQSPAHSYFPSSFQALGLLLPDRLAPLELFSKNRMNLTVK